MIEHTGVKVKNFEAAKEFYTKALAPLGYTLSMQFDGAAGYMEGGHTSFWIGEDSNPQGMHIAFAAKDKDAVDAFYEAAIASGGKDNGKPGYRDYSPGYYAAFVHDCRWQ